MALVFPGHIKIGNIAHLDELDSKSFAKDGIWESILSEKSVLIHASPEDVVVITDYLKEISESTWTYFNTHLITKPILVPETHKPLADDSE
ncbi:hypothetical protein HDV06_005257 [Boothiomyces sp. JEL0866]|nr:hypothetical protein HDV06_005257 [Boothiomyces sp. JEL0866]